LLEKSEDVNVNKKLKYGLSMSQQPCWDGRKILKYLILRVLTLTMHVCQLFSMYFNALGATHSSSHIHALF